MTKDETLRLALEALHGFIPHLPLDDETQCGRYDKVITAIKEALAQPEQDLWAGATIDERWYITRQPEPWEKFCDSNCVWTDHHPDCKLAQRKPLTDEKIGSCIDEVNLTSQYGHHHFGWHKQFARAIEAAHNIKE